MNVKRPLFSGTKNKKTIPFLLFSFFFFLALYSIALQSSQNELSHASDKESVTTSGASFRQRKPWLVFANKSDCKKASRQRVTENSGPLPTTSLLSVQGSGNTWLRWLIERLTGICTGSVYQENQMVGQGFKCELGAVYNGLTIVQKSHYFHHHKAEKTLLLVRLPFDALVSDYHRSKTQGNHTGVANASHFGGLEWENFVWARTGEWFDQIWTTMSLADELLVVFYENLLKDLKGELGRIAEFLQVFVTEERLQCVLRNQEGKLRRKKSARVANVAFSVMQREFVQLVIARAFTGFQGRNVPNIPSQYQTTADLVRARLEKREK